MNHRVQQPIGAKSLPSIQVLRGVAASLVMLYHASTHGNARLRTEFLNNFFHFGRCGIDLFFVLSGFVMLYAHYDDAGRTKQVWRYAGARFARIFPLYWVLMVPYFLCYLTIPDVVLATGIQGPFDGAKLARALFIYDQHHNPVIPVAWTLSYELLFYTVFSVYLLAGAWAFAVVASLWCALVAAQWAGLTAFPHPILLSPMILEFFAGCIAAVIVMRLPAARNARWMIAAAVLCAMVGLAENEGFIDPLRNVPNWIVPAFLLILAAANYDRGAHRDHSRLALFLGDASYSLYLTHLLVLDLLLALYLRYPWHTHPRLPLLVFTLTLWFVGALTYRMVERPLLIMVRRRLGLERREPRSQAPRSVTHAASA